MAQVQKARAHAEHLLDAFLTLRERFYYADLALFDPSVAARHSVLGKSRGLRRVGVDLYFYCIQDVAKIAFDVSRSVPSVANLIKTARSPFVQDKLKHAFSKRTSCLPQDSDEETKKLWLKLDEEEAERRGREFDANLSGLFSNWERFQSDKRALGYQSIRDKLTAHSELSRREDGEYAPFDLGKLGLSWADLGVVLEDLGGLVLALNVLFRNADFIMSEFEAACIKDAKKFWLD